MLRQRFLLIYALVALGLVANAAPSQPVAKDLHGDPLPTGAVARLGSDRWLRGYCTFAAFLPDGKRVVTVSPDRTIRVWEFPSGKEIKRITPPEPESDKKGGKGGKGGFGFVVVAMSKDGKTIALGGTEIYLCDLATGKESARLKWEAKKSPLSGKPFVYPVASLAFSPDGEHLTSIFDGGTIHTWDWSKAKQGSFAFPPTRRFFNGRGQLVYAPGGKSIAMVGLSVEKGAGQTGVVKLWDLATRTETWAIRTDLPFGLVISVAFSADGKTLAFASDKNNTITLVEAATGKEIGTLGKAKEGRRLLSLVFAKDGTKLYATDHSGLMEWDIASRKLLRKCATTSAKGISLSPDGNTLAVSGSSLEFLDLAGGKDITVRTRRPAALYSLQFALDGKNLLTTRGIPGALQKWDAFTGKDLGLSLPVPLNGIAVSPDGKVLAGWHFHSDAAKFVLVDAASGKELGQITLPANADLVGMVTTSFSPDGKILAIRYFGKDGIKIELYDVPAAKLRHSLEIQASDDYGDLMVFSHDSKTFASFPDAQTLGLWDTTTGRRIGSLSPPQSRFKSTTNGAFTPDGRCLAVDMGDGNVALYELATGQRRNRFGNVRSLSNINYERSSSLAFSPDGKSLVGGGKDGTVFLWDIGSGRERAAAAFEGHTAAVNAVAFAPDGKTFASASSDSTALIWDITKVDRPAPAAKALKSADLEKHWQALAETDAAKAWAAMGDLTAAPKEAVAFLKDRIKPAAPLDMKRVQELIAQLDDGQFKVREMAKAELLKLGEQLVPAIDKALAAKPPLETMQRLEALRGKLTGMVLHGEGLRAYRAVEILELIGTPAARQVLQTLADGAPGAQVTTSAQAALKR